MTLVQPSRKKAKALRPGTLHPAKELCNECGLCDTYYIHYVKEACAFLNQQFPALETQTYGRDRDLDDETEQYFGVHQDMMATRKRQPIKGAQWTGIVSTIAIEMLNQGKVEGVVCVQNTEDDRFYRNDTGSHSRSSRQQANTFSQSIGTRASRTVGNEAVFDDWGWLSDSGAPGRRKRNGPRKTLRPRNTRCRQRPPCWTAKISRNYCRSPETVVH